MSFESLLVHRATILRRAVGKDDLGQPTEEYVEYATDIPCRVTASSLGGGFANVGGEQDSATQRDAIMEDRRIYLQPEDGEDLLEDDKIIVKDKRGVTVVENPDITFIRRIYDGEGNLHNITAMTKVWRSGSRG